MHRTKTCAAISAVLATLVVTVAAVAAASQAPNNNAASGRVGGYSVSTVFAKAPISIKVVRGGYYPSAPTSLATLPKMKAKVVVPPGSKGLIDVRYTAEVECYGTLDGYCEIYAYVDGHAMTPSTTFGIVSTNGGTTSGTAGWIGGSMERTLVVGPGTHVVTLKTNVYNADQFDIDEQSLAVEVFKV